MNGIIENKFVENDYAGEIKVAEGQNPKKLFLHQSEAVRKMSEAINSKETYEGLLVLPTGGGKTLTACRWLMKNVLDKGQKVLWLAHRHELLNQAFDTFYFNAYKESLPNRRSIKYRIISGIHDKPVSIDKDDDIIIASKDSLNRNINFLIEKWIKPNRNNIFLVVDEAHHATAKTYRKIINGIKDENQKKLKMLGLTATPFRTCENENALLKKIFPDDIVHKEDLETLIDKGILSKPVISEEKTGSGFNFGEGLTPSEIREINRFDRLPEYVAREIAEGKKRNHIIVDHYLKNQKKYGKTLVFALNQAHAITLNTLFQDNGINSDYVISGIRDMKAGAIVYSEENTKKIEEFRTNPAKQVLINVNILTEGVDIPKIQTVFLTRPTISKTLMTQMIGRALRGPETGGTKDTYIVSFIDDWKDKIAWVSPEKIFIDEIDIKDPKDPKYNKRKILNQYIPVSLIEIFTRMMDETIEEGTLLKTPFVDKIPIGLYYFSYLTKTDSGEEIEKICDIMVFDHISEAYTNFINDLENIFRDKNLTDKEYLYDYEIEYLTAYSYDKFFKEYDTKLGYRKENISDILQYHASLGLKPYWIPFEDREKYDLKKVADNIYLSDLSISKQAEIVNKIWEINGSYWKFLFNGKKNVFINSLNIELNKLLYGEERPYPIDGPKLDPEKILIAKLPLQKIKEKDYAYWEELVDGVYGKAIDEEGNYVCALSGYKSKNKFDFEIDHIMPMSKGGLSVPENLQLLEKIVNRIKNDYYEESADIMINNIEKLIQEDYIDEALNKCIEGIEKYTDDNRFLNIQGGIYYRKGNYKDAISMYEKSNKIKKNHDAYLGIGLAYTKQNRADIAEYYFKEALKKDPKSIQANLQMGLFYYNKPKNKYAVYAIKYFKKVLEADEANDKANYNIACALVKKEEYREALKYINKSLELGQNEEKSALLNKINKNLR